MWDELSWASFLWGELSWGELSLGRVVHDNRTNTTCLFLRHNIIRIKYSTGGLYKSEEDGNKYSISSGISLLVVFL